eukprot:c25105_g6_i1 orf=174-1658(-)
MPQPHAIMICLPIQSHLSPFLWLAEYLVAQGVVVTFVHTATTVARLGLSSDFKGHSSNSRPASMRVEVVPDLLAPSATPSRDALLASMPVIKRGLEEVIDKIKSAQEAHGDDADGSALCCIFSDHIFNQIHDVASKYDIPIIDVVTNSAAAYAAGFYAPQLAERGYVLPVAPGSKEGEKRVDFIPGMPDSLKLADIPLILITDELNGKMFRLFCEGSMGARKADRVLVNSSLELEPDLFEAFRKDEPKIRIQPIGPMLIPNPSSSSNVLASRSLLPQDDSCMGWLDMQPEASVVYVSFGSMVTPDATTIHELALGLEASQQRFLWVIKSDSQSGGCANIPLPPSFKSTLSRGHGLIISWAPQLAVLAHPSVGAFITHCGWNSTLESLSFGVPMIGFPQEAEQNTNLKFIVDVWKVGLPLSSINFNNTTLDHASIEACVRAMICGEEGREARSRALELKRKVRECMLPHGTSKVVLENLVKDLKTGNLKKPSHSS